MKALKAIVLPGDELCIAAIAGQLLVQQADVRASVVCALTFAVGSDQTEVERLVKIADALIATTKTTTQTPCAAATELVLDSLDFLEHEPLANFLRNWDRTKNSGQQLIMLSAAVRLGSLYSLQQTTQMELPAIYSVLRHCNVHVRALAGLALAALCKESGSTLLWEVVAHTASETQSPDMDTAQGARAALHEVLAAHILLALDVAIDCRTHELERERLAGAARKNRRRRNGGGRAATGGSSTRTATGTSRLSTGQSFDLVGAPHTPESRETATPAPPLR